MLAAMFRTLERTEDLPPIGKTNERLTVDFKKQGSQDAFENAKDVAAGANAPRGPPMLGAARAGGLRARDAPRAAEEASTTQRNVEQAVRDRCRPGPVVSVSTIAKDAGFVVAVNVWPFPGQPVGVEIKPGELSCGQSGKQLLGVFYYPFRVATHTKSISPEQLPMFMDARVRRVAISLERAVGQPVIITSSRTRNGLWFATGSIVKVDVLDNAATFTVNIPGGPRTGGVVPASIALPFDVIDAVWRDGERWHVMIRGQVKEVEWNAKPDFDDDHELRAKKVIFDPLP